MSRTEINEFKFGDELPITTEHIFAIHQLITNLYGGIEDLRSPDMKAVIEKICAQINACQNRSDTINCATDIIYNLVRKAPFVAANKRTAILVANLVLYLHGFSLQADPNDVMQTLKNISEGKTSREETGEWLRTFLSAENLTAI